MLVAHLITGKRINLLAGYTREELKSIQNESGFYCPHCKEKVRIKAGNLKIWHFSHLPGLSNCILSSGESIYHLLGKKLLYEQAIKEFPETLLEPFFPEISQRPDLFIPPGGAIEFQCSTIPAPVFIDRCKGYINCGLAPVWILSKKRLKRLNASTFQIHSFDWLAARTDSSRHPLPSLLYFCPDEAKVYNLSSIVPVTSTRVYGKLHSIPLSDYSFKTGFHHLPPNKNGALFQAKSWLHRKKQWRLHAFKQDHLTYHRLKILFLKHRSAIAYFPSEAGMPVPYAYTLHEPSFVWQSYVLLSSVVPVPIGELVTFSAVFNHFKWLVSKKLITPRQLPLIHGVHYSFAIMQYLELLCFYGVMKRVGKKDFVKLKDPVFPNTMDKAIANDFILMEAGLKHGVNILFSGKM
ncbi:competence protein CoiA [Fictibacillus terranigra]|uniref:Competence protein CoiA family protein n=1 Tax=Fictibacillus terranigra TaxID=3058424 RepID=A0ABT8E713_9BACL|nr:competence protein CoiA family protein [Fictibacillus sp. CENA-BCM004]MDN4073685.1 competence protein CoiA family protein [Fictibacillus sp. CENA-BCM004]